MPFSPDRYQWQQDLKTAIEALKTKTLMVDKMWCYHEGNHPKVWLTEAIRDMFDDTLADDLSENWCETAIEQPLYRLRVTGWNSPEPVKPPTTEELAEGENSPTNSLEVKAVTNIIDDNNFDGQAQKDLYRHALVAGEAFMFVWKDDEKDTGWKLTFEDARRVWWPEDCLNEPDHVVLLWIDQDEETRAKRWRATVYYAVDVVRLVGPEIRADETKPIMPESGAFKLDDEEPGGEHGFDSVPVVRFGLGKKGISRLKKLIPVQNRINKLEANKMVAAEFAAFRQLILFSAQEMTSDDLQMRVNQILKLHPGTKEEKASIWEGSATELSNYDNSIDKEIDKFFSLASLPRHLRVNPGSPPSGDAVEADEGPFVEMILDMQDAFGMSWVDVFQLIGIEVEPQWHNPIVRSDKLEAEVVKIFKDAGIPVEFLLGKYAGWDQIEIDKLMNRPLSPQEAIGLAGQMATAAALGGADPADAQGFTKNMLGGGPNGQTSKPPPKPPVPAPPPRRV